MVESWNRANAVICYGNSGEIATLMLQDVLADQPWAGMLTPTDQRGLTPLFWTHVRPYGEVHLDLATRLELGRNHEPATGGPQ